MQKTNFIKGPSSGLGKAAARLFQSKGWNVIATMRIPEKEEELRFKAKEKLSTRHLSISEIAYDLDLGNPRSFSKLFKNKSSITPLEFRELFNWNKMPLTLAQT